MTDSKIYGHAAIIAARVEGYCRDLGMGPADAALILQAAAIATFVTYQRDPMQDCIADYQKVNGDMFKHLYAMHIQDISEEETKH